MLVRSLRHVLGQRSPFHPLMQRSRLFHGPWMSTPCALDDVLEAMLFESRAILHTLVTGGEGRAAESLATAEAGNMSV